MPFEFFLAHDIEEAKQAFERVRPIIEAEDPDNLSPHNVDIESAARIALGAEVVIAIHQSMLEKLFGFKMSCFLNLKDLAKAAWLLETTNVPEEPETSPEIVQEVATLRAKLLLWVYPLAQSGLIPMSAVKDILEGRHVAQDYPGELQSLATTLAKHWAAVKDNCGLKEEDIKRSLTIAPAVFAAQGRMENPALFKVPEQDLMVKKSWSALDRAYEECRRGIAYLRWYDGDADLIAPSLRRNQGPRTKKEEPLPVVPIHPVAQPVVPEGTDSIGDGSHPFLTKQP